MKRLKKIADVYYEQPSDKSVSKEQLQSCAEQCCNMLGIDNSVTQIDDSYRAYVIMGDQNEFTVSIDFYNTADGPEINRIIVGAPKGFPGKVKYVETREQKYLDDFLDYTNDFIQWVDEALEKIEGSETPR